MSTETQAVFEAALALDPVLRELLADRLLESLEEPGDEVKDEAFLAELQRRSEEFRRDPSCAVPLTQLWDDV
jgi:putative addiction module component (TIGR02574 family)